MAGDVKLRRSAVEAFGCPYRYAKIYREGVEDAGDEALRGRAFHVVALVYVMQLVAASLSSDHELAVLAFSEGMRLVKVPDHLRDEVGRLFFRWAERFELDVTAFLSAEELIESEEREFRPDLVYARAGELEVYDFKTYFKGLTDAQAKAELQPRWYLIEAKKAWPGFQRYRFTFDFVRLGFTVTFVLTADEVDALEPVVQSAIDQVEAANASGEYPAIPGSHCGLCRLKCPVVDEALALVDSRVTSPLRAQEVGGQILAMERRMKLLKKALSSYCSLEGPVTVGGETFSHSQSLTARYPADEALKVISDAGLDTARVTVSKTGLGFGSKIPARVWEGLAGIAAESRRSSFRHRKTGEDIPKGKVDLLADDDEEEEES